MRAAGSQPHPILWLAGALALLAGGAYAWLLASGEGLATALWALPLVMVAGYLMVFHFRTFFWLVPCLVPVSINMTDIGGGVGFSAPVEGFIWLIALVLLVKAFQEKIIDRRVFTHPMTWLVMMHTFWTFITSLTSMENLVSAKLLLARLVFLWVFYFFLFGVFDNVQNVLRFHRSYLLFFLPVILYATVKISLMGLNQKYSPAMSQPFYSDHTVYGATLALVLPLTVLLWWHRKALGLPAWLRSTLLPICLLLVVGILFSYSRAAWLSLAVCLGFAMLLRIRLRFVTLLGMMLLVGAGVWTQWDQIVLRLESNKVKGERDILKHAQSITDVEQDESNKERINRWTAALQMAQEKPVFGFGPGTYERFYGTYQYSTKMTRISTKRGDRGDAHSEYLTALSEQGLPGLVIWLALVLGSLAVGMRAIYRAPNLTVRVAATGILLGLVTFYVHAFVNDFLDIEKVNTLFWSSLAALAMLEIKGRQATPPPHPTPTAA